MKTLVLLRHAKSAPASPGQDDADRPLSGDGGAAAGLMATYLRDRGPHPDRILCSAARRTQQTLAAVVSVLDHRPPVEVSEAFYLASAKALGKIVRRLDDGCACVMLVGHNPGLEQLSQRLVGEGEAVLRKALQAKLPTGAVAVIDLPAARWSNVADGSGTLRAFVVPKSLTPPPPG